jgi:hypothetical protein
MSWYLSVLVGVRQSKDKCVASLAKNGDCHGVGSPNGFDFGDENFDVSKQFRKGPGVEDIRYSLRYRKEDLGGVEGAFEGILGCFDRKGIKDPSRGRRSNMLFCSREGSL